VPSIQKTVGQIVPQTCAGTAAPDGLPMAYTRWMNGLRPIPIIGGHDRAGTPASSLQCQIGGDETGDSADRRRDAIVTGQRQRNRHSRRWVPIWCAFRSTACVAIVDRKMRAAISDRGGNALVGSL